ncbi:MAG: bifunctional folylpolyglutamate synthase/dihydrofolate synthase [Magnetococcales bacterium]|nr:bifunctional folylpolyglutamate synthase/dihydrofolate synthase [Magnetococcales bacterium]
MGLAPVGGAGAVGRLSRLLERVFAEGLPGIQLGLERPAALLAALGHPERGIAAIHVAGTNGKGSTVAFLGAMLTASGYRVGSYTSPHLQRLNERIAVDGEAISDADLVACLEPVMAIGEAVPATFFERLTAAAFLHFARSRPDWVVLETGLGGRLDATNLVVPRVAVVTSIGLDHTGYLGSTVAAIAREKAGIFKPGVPAVAAPGGPEAARELEREAARVGCELWLEGRDFGVRDLGGEGFLYEDGAGSLRLPPPGLVGIHQKGNAALAVAALRLLQGEGCALAEGALARGVAAARWPGRLERFAGRPEIWLDGAHNPGAAAVLARELLDLRLFSWGHTKGPVGIELVFSALRDKDVVSMAAILAPRVDRVWTVGLAGERGLGAAYLAGVWERAGVPACACGTPDEALERAARGAYPEGRVVVAGSLYLVGAVRALLVAGGGEMLRENRTGEGCPVVTPGG